MYASHNGRVRAVTRACSLILLHDHSQSSMPLYRDYGLLYRMALAYHRADLRVFADGVESGNIHLFQVLTASTANHERSPSSWV